MNLLPEADTLTARIWEEGTTGDAAEAHVNTTEWTRVEIEAIPHQQITGGDRRLVMHSVGCKSDVHTLRYHVQCLGFGPSRAL